MTSELREFIDAERVLFGMRQCLRHEKKLAHVFIAADTRPEMLEKLNEMKFKVEQIELSKKEIAAKLELGFLCEVFGVKK